jgi:hydrogenase maturation protease
LSGTDGSAVTVRVLGVGNVLVGDDGLGPYTVRVLESEFEFDEAVEVLDVGTPGLDFTPYLENARSVIVVDTVKSDAEPGTIKIYRQDEILAMPVPARTNPHEPGLREALMATELTDCSPGEVVLVGVVPSELGDQPLLSDPIRAAVPRVVDAIVDELRRLDLEPTRRATPLPLDIWWEVPPAEVKP